MKILFISPSFYPATFYGGPIFSLYNSTRCLSKNGIQVYVSTTNCDGTSKMKVKPNIYLKLEPNLNVKYYGLGTSKGFSFWMYLLLWQDMIGKDIVYLVSIFSPPTPLVIFLNIFFRKPIIISARGQLGDWSLKQGNRFKKLWLKIFINPIASKITWEATSISEKEMILRVYPEAYVEVIPSIINADEFQNLTDRVLNKKVTDYSIYKKLSRRDFTGKRVIISMGRLHKVKGFDILIEAMKIVKDQVKVEDCVLLIAGEDFGERKNLEDLIDKLELQERVFLVGMIEGEDKKEFLKNADVFALASHHENFGIVYAEALAAGIPIIASENTPWQDSEKFNFGKWVATTPNKFAEAIGELLNSDVKVIGNNGTHYVEKNFSCASVFQKFNSLIKKILLD